MWREPEKCPTATKRRVAQGKVNKKSKLACWTPWRHSRCRTGQGRRDDDVDGWQNRRLWLNRRSTSIKPSFVTSAKSGSSMRRVHSSGPPVLKNPCLRFFSRQWKQGQFPVGSPNLRRQTTTGVLIHFADGRVNIWTCYLYPLIILSSGCVTHAADIGVFGTAALPAVLLVNFAPFYHEMSLDCPMCL